MMEGQICDICGVVFFQETCSLLTVSVCVLVAMINGIKMETILIAVLSSGFILAFFEAFTKFIIWVMPF